MKKGDIVEMIVLKDGAVAFDFITIFGNLQTLF